MAESFPIQGVRPSRTRAWLGSPILRHGLGLVVLVLFFLVPGSGRYSLFKVTSIYAESAASKWSTNPLDVFDRALPPPARFDAAMATFVRCALALLVTVFAAGGILALAPRARLPRGRLLAALLGACARHGFGTSASVMNSFVNSRRWHALIPDAAERSIVELEIHSMLLMLPLALAAVAGMGLLGQRRFGLNLARGLALALGVISLLPLRSGGGASWAVQALGVVLAASVWVEAYDMPTTGDGRTS
jgi:hypothetical protein